MTANLTQDRMALPYTFKSGSLVLAGSVKALKGGVACIDTSANVVKPMATGNTNLIRVGLFLEDNDNSGTTATSRVMVELDKEIVGQWLDNSTAAAVTTSNLYGSCYMDSDHSVSVTSSGNAAAGTVWDLDTIKGVAVVVIP